MREGAGNRAEETRGCVGGGREDDGAHLNGFFAAGADDGDLIAAIGGGGWNDGGNRRAGAEMGRELFGERARERRDAAAKRAQRRRAGALAFWRARFDGAAEDAAVLAFPFCERGECRAETEFFRITRVNARYEGRNEIFEDFVAEFAADEIGDGLIGIGRAR